MKVKALKSFIGKISMNIDDEKEIIDKKLAKDLIKAGHVIEIKTDKKDKKSDKETKETTEEAVETTEEAE